MVFSYICINFTLERKYIIIKYSDLDKVIGGIIDE